MIKRIDQMIVDFKGALNEKSIRDLKIAIFHKVQNEKRATVLVSLKALECKKDLPMINLLIREIEKNKCKIEYKDIFYRIY